MMLLILNSNYSFNSTAMADSQLRTSQSYFSALARGGLTAALSYN